MADGSAGIGHNGGPVFDAELPAKFIEGLCNPDGSWRVSRYKAWRGGRGGAKSWGIARTLICLAAMRFERILCCREYQVSIADSVHKLLVDQIDAMGMAHLFIVTEKSIFCPSTGSEFLFKGLRKNIREIKSLEGITKTWVEEAQAVSKESWQILRPTVFRRKGGECWISYNPDGTEDPTHEMCVGNPLKNLPPLDGMICTEIGYQDNPWFPEDLEAERRADLATATATGDMDAYNWIWEGHCRVISDAIIFRRRMKFEAFTEPHDPPPKRIYLGADWGFANDPAALIRFYITEEPNLEDPAHSHEHLWITDEAFGHQVEIDELGKRVFDLVPGSKLWPIKADSARPEIISYMSRRGYNVTAAEKWPGSVEDGVDHMRGFKAIHVDPDKCPHIAREFRLYKYKVDEKTGDVLPIIVDAWNHGIDAIRYGLDGVIQKRGGLSMWAKLAK